MTTSPDDTSALKDALMHEYKRQRDHLEVTVVALRGQLAAVAAELEALKTATPATPKKKEA